MRSLTRTALLLSALWLALFGLLQRARNSQPRDPTGQNGLASDEEPALFVG